MNNKFAAIVEALQPKLDLLLASAPGTAGLSKDMPQPGVYLFSEAGHHLYAGRSNNMRQRYSQHTRPGSPHNHAVFAFRLACEETGSARRSYRRGEGSRIGLSADARFSAAFSEAKTRVRAMSYRFVEEDDPTQQALLELYVAITLGCRYNDFDNH